MCTTFIYVTRMCTVATEIPRRSEPSGYICQMNVPHYIHLQDTAPSGNGKQIPSDRGIAVSVFGINFIIQISKTRIKPANATLFLKSPV
jgi:hypothetical protein